MSFQMLNYWNPKQSHSKLDIKVSIIGFLLFFLFASSWISHHQFATGNGIAIHISTIDMMKFIKQKCMVSHCKPFCVSLLFFRIDSNPHILGLSSYFCHINQWKVCMLLVFSSANIHTSLIESNAPSTYSNQINWIHLGFQLKMPSKPSELCRNHLKSNWFRFYLPFVSKCFKNCLLHLECSRVDSCVELLIWFLCFDVDFGSFAVAAAADDDINFTFFQQFLFFFFHPIWPT